MNKNFEKRILVTTTTFPSFLKNDVTPPFVYELSKRLAKKKDLEIIVSTSYVKNSKEYDEKDNLKIYRYKYGFTALRDGAILPNIKKNKLLVFQIPFFILFSFLNIVKLVKKEKIDIIHAHWIIPQGFLAVLYKKIFRRKDLKIICTVHGGDIFSLRNWFFTKIKKWTLNNIDEITVVSEEVKEEVERIRVPPLKKGVRGIFTMPMGVDENVFSPEKYDKSIKRKYNITGPFLLFVGRLVEKKGVKYAISAMPAVLKKYPDAKFIIVGEGPLENELESQIKKLNSLELQNNALCHFDWSDSVGRNPLNNINCNSDNKGIPRLLTRNDKKGKHFAIQDNLENNIIFAGGVPNRELPKYYATADIFLGPSVTAKNGDSEGFGLIFVEALLCKCCVISSNLKAISDIIKNEKTGIQVDVKNTELFADKIIDLIDDENKRKKLAENGYEFVKERFTWDVAVERYYDLIRNLS